MASANHKGGSKDGVEQGWQRPRRPRWDERRTEASTPIPLGRKEPSLGTGFHPSRRILHLHLASPTSSDEVQPCQQPGEMQEEIKSLTRTCADSLSVASPPRTAPARRRRRPRAHLALPFSSEIQGLNKDGGRRKPRKPNLVGRRISYSGLRHLAASPMLEMDVCTSSHTTRSPFCSDLPTHCQLELAVDAWRGVVRARPPPH